MEGNYSREETTQERILHKEIRYVCPLVHVVCEWYLAYIRNLKKQKFKKKDFEENVTNLKTNKTKRLL